MKKSSATMSRMLVFSCICFALFLGGCGGGGATEASPAVADPATELAVPTVPVPSPVIEPVTVSKTVHLTACGVLDQPGTMYVLDNDVRSEGTCFTVKADSVILDLNGHTVLYDDYPDAGLPNPDFEAGTGAAPADWDLSQAAGVTRRSTASFAMLNNWYLAFGNAPNGTRVVSPWMTLPGSAKAAAYFLRGDPTWGYSQAPLWNMTIEARDGTGATGVVLNRNFTADQRFDFTATPVQSQYRAILTLVDGYGLNLLNFGLYPSIDLFDIRARANYGIDVSYRKNVVVQNGRVTQGRGKGLLSHGVYAFSDTNFRATGLTITVNGMESSAIYGNYSNHVSVDNCDIVATTPGGTFNRSQLNAAVIVSQGSDIAITDNKIDSGAGYGDILTNGRNTEIARNTLKTQSMITNHFAIIGGSKIHHNTIVANPGQGISGDTAGSGINVDGIEVYNNSITIMKTAPNYEYGYIGTDAIKFNDYNDATIKFKNINVHDNTIYLYGEYDKYYTGYDATPAGTKLIKGITNLATGGNVRYSNNTVIARKVDSSVRLIGIEPGNMTNLEVLFQNNTVDSDHICIDFGGYSGQGNIPPYLTFTGNTFIKGPGASGSYHTIGMDRTGNITTDSISFIGTKLLGGASLADVELPSSYGRFSYGVSWIMHVQVLNASGAPVPGAGISIQDKNFTSVYTGVTDSSGVVRDIQVKQYQHTGNGLTSQSVFQYYAPVQLTVVPAGGASATYSVDLTQNKTITYRVGSGFTSAND